VWRESNLAYIVVDTAVDEKYRIRRAGGREGAEGMRSGVYRRRCKFIALRSRDC